MANNLTPQIEAARQVLASIEFFGAHYASSVPFQQHKQQLIEMLMQRAANVSLGDPKDNFYSRFAAAIEKLP